MTGFIEIVDTEDDGFDVSDEYEAPFDMEVNCHKVYVYGSGSDLSEMKLTGNCEEFAFCDVYDYNEVDISGFMDLEIGEIGVSNEDKGLLKILELKCRKVWSADKKLEKIMNKYVQEESDPLMRDIQGFKLEMAVNGYGDNL